MRPHESVIKGLNLLLIILVAVGLAGCYTVLRHPSVADEEKGEGYELESSGASCTDCHNNEYDHRWMSPHTWGYGSWLGYSRYNYYGYGGWRSYYQDPWWWGWGGWYYDPWPFYPPGGGGSVTPMEPYPERSNTRRSLQQAPPSTPPPQTPPPAYSPPPSQNQGEGQQNNNTDDSGGRKGRRGKS